MDEQNGNEAPPPDVADAGAGEVSEDVATRLRNSEWAKARRHFESIQREQAAELEALRAQLDQRDYERAQRQYDRDRRLSADAAARNPHIHPREVPKPEILKRGAPQAAAPAQKSEMSELLELMRLDIASRMADKLPRRAPTHPTPGAQLNADIADEVGGLDPKMTESQRLDATQRIVLDKLKNIKIQPTKK